MKKMFLVICLTFFGYGQEASTGHTVTDSKTGLEWQDDILGETVRWQEAIDYCEALDLDGHSDWRLPNINELKTIIDRSKSNPAIVDGFEKVSSSLYWSSSTFKGREDDAWVVVFDGGGVRGYAKDYSLMCVALETDSRFLIFENEA